MSKILVVDDDSHLRSLVCETLRPKFDVIEASNGIEAMGRARQEIPDLVFLDVNMPGADGFEVCTAIKQDPATSHVPVVMLTGRGSRTDFNKGKKAGADGYFTKPFSPTKLLDQVYEILER